MDQLMRTVPLLASLNIDSTVRFYRDKPGFDKPGRQDQPYGIRGFSNLDEDGNLLKFGQKI